MERFSLCVNHPGEFRIYVRKSCGAQEWLSIGDFGAKIAFRELGASQKEKCRRLLPSAHRATLLGQALRPRKAKSRSGDQRPSASAASPSAAQDAELVP